MRILYFSQFFPPENIAAAFRAGEHSRIWSSRGHEVTVFTGWPNYPTGRLFDGYAMTRFGEERLNGVRVLRSKVSIDSNTNLLKRVIGGGSFLGYGALNCLLKSKTIGFEFDVVLATSGTVFAAILGKRYAQRNGIPFVLEIRDITYRQMVATGSAESGLKVRLMKSLELSLCKAADHIVVLTEGFKGVLVSEGVESQKISVVPNGADIVPCSHNWSGCGRVKLGYFGTMGISQDVPGTIRIVQRLNDAAVSASYLLVGEGAARCEVENYIEANNLSEVVLMHGMSKEELEEHYADVDMTVVSLQCSDSFAETIPSKIFQSFARGVPVLFFGPDGEAANLVRTSGGGIVVGDFVEIDDLVAFFKSPNFGERLAKMSENALLFMEREYTRERLAEEMLSCFDLAIDGKREKTRTEKTWW